VIWLTEVAMTVGRVRVVRDMEDARDLVQRWRDSREGLAAWCEREGVSRQSMQWWRIRVEGETGGGVVRVAEVVLRDRAAAYRVVLGNGREVVVDDGFDDSVLSRLLAVVDR
jgi:hypothetical protein